MPDPAPAAAAPEASPPAATATAAPAAAPPTPAAAPAAPAADLWKDFKAPEGYDVEKLKGVVEFAKANGMDPKAAAALAAREKAREDADEAEYKQLSEKGWLEQLTKDPVLGGQKIRETMVDVQRAADRLSPAIQKMIQEEGVLYNPVVVRILHDIGTKLREDAFVRPGATPAPEQKASLDDRLTGMFVTK